MVIRPALRSGASVLMKLQAGLDFSGRKRLPLVRAAEAAECGAACMVMVSRYHGHDVDLNGLRQRFTTSLAGATLKGLMVLAGQLGLTGRPLRVELEDLATVPLPAILHWDLNHFVVLKKVNPRSIVIHDPSVGIRQIPMAEASKHFTGVVLELSPAARFEPVVARSHVKLNSLWSRTTGVWPVVLQIVALSVALQLVAFAMPFQMQLVIDEGALRGDAGLLVTIAIAFSGLVILHTVIEALRGWLIQTTGQLLSFQMVGNVVHHLIRLKSNWFEKRSVGDILSRISSATSIQDTLTHGVVTSLIDGVMALVAIVILVAYSPPLAGVVVGAVALNTVLALSLFPMMRARNEQQIVERAREQSQLMETVRAATTIKVMGREAEREGVWRNLFAAAVNAAVSAGKVQIAQTAIQSLINGLQTVIVLYLGARMVIEGAGFSIGMLVAFLAFRQTFTDRANALVSQAVQFKFIGLHLDRLADIVTAEADPGSEGLPSPMTVRGSMTLTDVGFRYGSTDRAVLEDLNLSVEEGEYLAITGVSGGGKTTLLKLMLGLHAPSSGLIKLDDQPASPEVWRAWRDRVGLVAQDDRLMSGSIAENIAFFDPDIDMARVEAAAKTALVDDDIARMPMRYLSLVGDMGSILSGGQKQRVLLARALYREPRILILDEGTANLDVATEEAIAQVLEAMPITRIVVAHRPALLARADRVLELVDGKLRPLSAGHKTGGRAKTGA